MSAVVVSERELRQQVGLDSTALEAIEKAFSWASTGRAVMPPIMHIDVVKIASGFFGNAVWRDHRLTVEVRPKGELHRVPAFNWQLEQVAEHGEDQPLAVRRNGDIRSGDLGCFELDGVLRGSGLGLLRHCCVRQERTKEDGEKRQCSDTHGDPPATVAGEQERSTF
jgi:hypothetical protein